MLDRGMTSDEIDNLQTHDVDLWLFLHKDLKRDKVREIAKLILGGA